MDNKKITALLLVLFSVAFVFCSGCTASQIEHAIEEVADLDPKVSSVLTTVEISGIILHKISELHKAGVDQKVIDEIRDAMLQAHQVVDKHHQKHIFQTQ